MDTKRLIGLVLVLTAFLMLWPVTIRFIGKQLGYDMDAPPALPTTVASTEPFTPATQSTATTDSTAASGPNISPAALSAVTTSKASTVTLGSATKNDPNFTMAIELSSEGASISRIVLNQFTREVSKPAPFVFQEPYPGFDKTTRVLATRSVTINGKSVNLDGVAWNLVEQSASHAKFSLDFADNNGATIARIIKTFALLQRSDPSKGYEIRVSYAMENLTDQPLEISTQFNGPTSPPVELERGSDRSIVGGFDDGKTVMLNHHFIEEFDKKNSTRSYARSEKEKHPVLWAGVSSLYFNGIIRPEPLAKDSLSPKYIEAIDATALNPDSDAAARHVAMVFKTTTLQVAAKQTLTLPMRAFFGPKMRSVMNDPYYTAKPLHYDATLVMTSGFCGICTFQWLIDILVTMLGWFHFATRDWGLAIIILVFVVRAILHPISKKSQVNMMKMSKFGPEMERIKTKYADDKDEMQKQMMRFYKEHGAGPLLGCLPMFLQMPIWIALWSSLQSTFELRHAPLLYGFTWIKDLSQPDHLVQFATPFKLFFIPVSGINILPLVVAGMFYLQQKLTPKPPTMTPEQEQQQKMMQWMSLIMFPLFMYAAPSGLNLYTLTSFGIGIIESKLIRKHIKEQEEAEKSGKVIIDAGKKVGVKRVKSTEVQPEQKSGGVMGWISDLQKRAEQLRDDTDKKRKDREP